MRIAVVGALGHTGRFVLAELLSRGHAPLAIGRDRAKLAALDGLGLETRVASLDDPASLDRALAGARAVIHCAGPFQDTADALVRAALRAQIHYLDVTAEQTSARSTLESFDAAARAREVVILPAAGFFGGLGDLLATAAMREWTRADRVDLAIGLDRWWPTLGTRQTGARNSAPRLVFAHGKLETLQPSPPKPWRFPAPFETQDVVELPFTETVLISTHLSVPEIHTYINRAALREVGDPATPAPPAADERGPSKQLFVVDARVRRGKEERRVRAQGRDIYAFTAPLVVEAAERACAGALERAGAFALGDLFDARDFLRALAVSGELSLETDA
jgi:hypothetical protein